MNPSEIGIILLAAGDSSRMGQSKQLLSVQGEPLLLKSVKSALNTYPRHVVVVLGANEAEHKKIINHLPVHIVNNLQWQKGMGSSIKAGLNSLRALDADLAGVIILVCDQPLLSSAHIKNLITEYNQTQKPIIASRYSETAGVPVLFEKFMFDVLMALDDEQGAKKIIQQNIDKISAVAFPEGSIDLDTMKDYDRFRKDREAPK